MLGAKPLTVPATSSVPLDKIHEGGRKPLISVTLKPGTDGRSRRGRSPQFVADELGAKLAEYPDDPRDRLAALVTAPQNERFAQVMANRVWTAAHGPRPRRAGRRLGERGKPSHPELLRWLGREFVRGGYDLKHLARLILNSHAYQRAADRALKEPGRCCSPPRRRGG